MNTSDDRVRDVRLTDDTITFELMDGRAISAPLALYPTLDHATPADRDRWEIQVWGVHWPLLDADISAQNLLSGIPEARRKSHAL